MAPTAVDPDPTDHLLAPAPAPVAVAGGGVGGDGPLEVVINVSSSDTDSDSPGAGGGKRSRPVAGRGGGRDREEKKARILAAAATVPAGFLEPLPPPLVKLLPPPAPGRSVTKQFWKAGDYVGKSDHLLAVEAAQHSDSGMDHVRVHPKFLHSNATSHKWALGAFAELLDNSLDEVVNGATYVHIDMMESKKDGTRMLLIEDNGGGMNPDKMRHCMSLGYSAKSKVKNTIGQYGNGFKTSTMRLGADVLVFSRSRGIEGTRPTQSVGMLSYTFLRSTNKEDIIVPMFGSIGEQGTRIIIYNLWEDDEGELELDFDADANDIQIRGVNRDQNKIQKANQFPNSKHFFTYRHSLRSYASILYLLLPENFEMILRGKKIEHHNIINDLMLKKQLTYKPTVGDGLPKDMHMAAKVTIGFVKDARQHIDIQGFNVYHKNRLIKPFWRVWTAAGSGGRGIIGVLEVNFVEPAHDKQDFERTNCLARLEARLNRMQKKYWSDNRHRIGYGINDASTDSGKGERGLSPRPFGKGSLKSGYLQRIRSADRSSSRTISQQRAEKSANTVRPERSVLHGLSDTGGGGNTEIAGAPFRSTSPILRTPEKSFCKVNTSLPPPNGVKRSERIAAKCQSKEVNVTTNGDGESIMDPEAVIKKLKEENSSLEDRILMLQESLSRELQIERDKNKSLTERFEDVERQLELAIKEQEATVELFAEERKCRDQEEENLKKKLREASSTIQDLMEQLNAARNCCKRKQQTKQLHPQ
ncbi:protein MICRORCHIDIA 7-like isoform X3 [Miscanthus floridulus]|uniref:protein MICRORCHIDIA 7-like isoform X3 n=1 Tax=Miscanthus floridulus TaxID=154761 RepID=UPI00345825A5